MKVERHFVAVVFILMGSMLYAEGNKHEYVDLGLPSGTFWATCNVGADSPEDVGGFYAWGEIQEKATYELESYVHYKMQYERCANLGNISKTAFDVAHEKWGGDWRMPTLDEIKELVEVCTWEWTERNNVGGMLVTGPNGESIFLPGTGYRWGGMKYAQEDFGYYWTDTQRGYYQYDHAWTLYFDYTGVHTWGCHYRRYHGHVIRPVFTLFSGYYAVNLSPLKNR